MPYQTGRLIAFEGIDGSGTSTQTRYISKEIGIGEDVLITYEPWNRGFSNSGMELSRMLTEDSDAYSHSERMAELYVQNRKEHHESIIIPVLNQGGIVLCDRHALSTFTYQGVQGVSYEKIKLLHEEADIIMPDLTLFLDVDYEIAQERLRKRFALQKFERDAGFTKKLIEKYRKLSDMAQEDKTLFGRIVRIDGNRKRKEVTKDILFEVGGEINEMRNEFVI